MPVAPLPAAAASAPAAPVAGGAIRFAAADGYPLGGFLWDAGSAEPERPVVVVTAATSVRCRYYARFAADLAENGSDVVTYDYRGIGESRPERLAGFRADWPDWGLNDLEGALAFAGRRFPGRPLDVVAHSIGGLTIGLAPSNGRIRRIVTVGSQYAHWRDYAPERRTAMLLKWHVAMPALAMAFGYLPAKRLGWMEDTPRGVALDWSLMGPRFEESVRRRPAGRLAGRALADGFGRVVAPILAIGIDDDPFGTPAALERLHRYFTASPRLHWRIAPDDVGAAEIGHFAFFHDRFRDSLWPIVRGWLADGALPPAAPGRRWPG